MVTEKNWETNTPASESTERQANYGSNTTVNGLDACLDSVASKTDGASDSDFDERDVSAEDDDSIPPEEDAADEEEVSSLMKESQMSLDELLATYGISSNTDIRSINTPASKGRPARLKGGRRTATPPTINTSTQESLESIPPTKKSRRTATTSSVDTENTDPQTTRSVQRNRPTSINHTITYSSSSDVEGLIEKKSDDSPLCCLTSFTHPHSVPCSHSASPVSIDVSFSDPSSTAPTPKHSRRPPVDNSSRMSLGHSLRSRAKSNSANQNSIGLLDNTIPSNTPLDKQSEKEEMETVLSDSDSGDVAERECQESSDGKAVKVKDGDDEGEEEEAVAVTTEVEEGEEEDNTKCENNEDYSSRFWKNAITGQATPLSYNSDEDEDYCPSEDSGQDWKGEIKIGDDYQVNVPILLLSASTSSNLRNGSTCVSSYSGNDFSGCAANARAERVFEQSSLVWRPVDKLSEADVIRYERLYAETIMSSLPSDRTIDDEEALFLLMLCDYDVEEALQRLQLKAVQPTEVPGYLESWSEADCTAFEKSFALYGKDFRQIRDTRLRHKTVSEVIHFYYLWKKTARHDGFARIYRRDKKKSSHPNITDFMDCLATEQEILAESYMQNVSDMPVMPSSSTVTPTPTMTTSNSDANPITNKFHPIAPDNDAVLLTSNCQLDISSGGQKVKAVSTNCDDTDSPLGRLKGSLVDSDASSLNKIPSSPSTEHEVAPTSSSSSLNTTPVSRSKMKSAIGGPTSTPPVVPTTTTTTNNNDNCSVNEVCGYTMMKQSDHQLTINSAASTRSTRTSSSSSTAIV